MGSDLASAWGPQEARESRIVFIGIDLPRDIIEQGLRQSLAA
jgi:G3E family GTPase